jgi:hypothetical protein
MKLSTVSQPPWSIPTLTGALSAIIAVARRCRNQCWVILAHEPEICPSLPRFLPGSVFLTLLTQVQAGSQGLPPPTCPSFGFGVVEGKPVVATQVVVGAVGLTRFRQEERPFAVPKRDRVDPGMS